MIKEDKRDTKRDTDKDKGQRKDMTLSHLDEGGQARMVDVSGKSKTKRTARAQGEISMSPHIIEAILAGDVPKGDVLAVGRIAGIMGAKKTPDLIPMCHPLMLTSTQVDAVVKPETSSVQVTAQVSTTGVTGVEMEALTAVSLALLSIYDMIKALDKSMVIGQVRLLEKKGGKSGTYRREDASHD